MKRVHVFPTAKTSGKVLLVNKYASFGDFSAAVTTKFDLFNVSKIRFFTHTGAEVTDLDEMCHEDVLYFTTGEDLPLEKMAVTAFLEVAQLKARVAQLESAVMDGTVVPAKQHGALVRTESDMFNALENLDSNFTVEHPETLLVFVNTKSGGQLGKTFAAKFKKYVKEDQVIELDEKGPVPALTKWKNVKNLKVIAAGGDGTVKWILESIDKVGFAIPPAVGVLPLGTGNDIARVFNWGGGASGSESIKKFLAHVTHSQGVKLDRWSVTVDEIVDEKLVRVKSYVMSNYFSYGLDAKIALQFHNARNQTPGLFSSHMGNKLMYIGYGFQSMMENTFVSSDVCKLVDVEVNGKKLSFAETFEGIVFLNLPSYAGGCMSIAIICDNIGNMWGLEPDDVFAKQSINDGIMEVVGIRNATHLGQIESGMATAVRLAQGKSIKMTFRMQKKSLPFQIDGEPWDQNRSCIIEIKFCNQANILARYSL